MAYEHNPDLPLPIDLLPHRPPLLYVNGIISANEERVHAFWKPGPDHIFDDDALRDMKTVEALAQAGALAIYLGSEEPPVPLFAGIEKAEFDNPIFEGETIELKVEILDKDKRGFKGRGTAKVDGLACAEATISGNMIPLKVAQRLFAGLKPNVVDPELEAIHNPNLRAVSEVLDDDPQDLWLDGVSSASKTYATGFWRPTQEQYAGHAFGGQPILPGIKQVGSLQDLTRYVLEDDAAFIGLEDVTFSRTVLPGERLELKVEINHRKPIWTSEAVAKVAGQEACRATLLFDAGVY